MHFLAARCREVCVAKLRGALPSALGHNFQRFFISVNSCSLCTQLVAHVMSGKMHNCLGRSISSLVLTFGILTVCLLNVSSVESRSVLGSALSSTLKLRNSLPQSEQPAALETSFKRVETAEDKTASVSGMADFQSWPLVHQFKEVVQRINKGFGAWLGGQENAVAPCPPAPLMPIPNARQVRSCHLAQE